MSRVVANAIIGCVLIIVGSNPSVGDTISSTSSTFVTTTGTGPDKWASVWYVDRHLDPLHIHILPSAPDSTVDGVTFDYPNSRFNRTGSSSTLSALIDHYSVRTDEVDALETFIKEIEFEPWNTDKSIMSGALEIAFRTMQLRYGRNDVGRRCYLKFFDNFASKWRAEELTHNNAVDALVPAKDCLDGSTVQPGSLKFSVPEVSQQDILKKLAANEKVLFIDTRESMEFAEGHIPASINLKLREVNEASALGLPSADLVVAYCVKDFRGYEAARKLRRLGLNAVIMKPYGIKGWIDAGLPIAGPRGTTESGALELLEQQLDRYR